MGLLLVTHDVGVAAESVDEVLVMRHGRAVEHGPGDAVLGAPAQPYTRELLGAVPRVDAPRAPSAGAGPEVVLEATGLRREFGRGKRAFAAVDDVSLTIRARRDPRCRGRERQRQDDPGADAGRAPGADGGRGHDRARAGACAPTSRWSSRTPSPPSTPAAAWASR